MGLDLGDWLRGERNWLDLWDLIDQLPLGSKYRAAKLRDPNLIETLAAQEDPEDTGMPLDGWNQYLARMANIEDLLAQILYATLHTDPSVAPSTERPEMPHVKRRKEIQAQLKADAWQRIEAQLFPAGGDDDRG